MVDQPRHHARRGSSWERARQVADALPADDPDRTSMRIAPRTGLCTSTWRVGLGVADTGFDELRGLCCSAGDDMSLAIAMYGQVAGLNFEHRHREASKLGSEQFRLIEESANALRGVAVIHGAVVAKLFAGEAVEAYRLAQWSIDLVGSDPVKGRRTGFGSPLALSLFYRGAPGRADWRDDIRSAIAIARSVDANGLVLQTLISVAYTFGILTGALLADDDALQETTEAVRIAEEGGDDVGLELARIAQGLVLSRRATAAERDVALELLRRARDAQVRQRMLATATMADVRIVELTAQGGEVQARSKVRGASSISSSRTARSLRAVLRPLHWWSLCYVGDGTPTCGSTAAIERLAAVPTDPGFVLHEMPLRRMRALLARAHADKGRLSPLSGSLSDDGHQLGFEGHMQWAEAMP